MIAVRLGAAGRVRAPAESASLGPEARISPEANLRRLGIELPSPVQPVATYVAVEIETYWLIRE